MVKKAIFAFKKATKAMGLLLVVFLIYSFYDSSVLFNPHVRMVFFAIWIGYFLYFFLWKNPRDKSSDW